MALPSLSALPTLSGGRSRARTPDPTLDPEQERSLLNRTLGGMAFVGRTLDKPGAAARGLLFQQDPRALLNLIPFSDTLGITDPADRVYTQDVLESAGITPKNKPGLNLNDAGDIAGDVAGFVGDVVTDPLFWITGPLGTLSKLGKTRLQALKTAKTLPSKLPSAEVAAAHVGDVAAKKAAGTLSTSGGSVRNWMSLADEVRRGERGLMGLKVPFGPTIGSTNFGMSAERAATVVEKIGFGGGRANPLVIGRGLFTQTGDLARFDAALQMKHQMETATRAVFQDAITDIAPAMAHRHQEMLGHYEQIAAHFGEKLPNAASHFRAFQRYLVESAQGLPKGGDMVAAIAKDMGTTNQAIRAAGLGGPAYHLSRQLDQYVNFMKTTSTQQFEELVGLGLKGRDLVDPYAQHGARALTSQQSSFMKARRSILKAMPGGSQTINPLVMNSILRGYVAIAPLAPDAMAEAIAKGKAGLGKGVVVAASDRANFGTVLGPAGKGEWTVFFRSRKGDEQIVDLAEKVLTPTGRATREFYEETAWTKLPKADHKALLIDRLESPEMLGHAERAATPADYKAIATGAKESSKALTAAVKQMIAEGVDIPVEKIGGLREFLKWDAPELVGKLNRAAQKAADTGFVPITGRAARQHVLTQPTDAIQRLLEDAVKAREVLAYTWHPEMGVKQLQDTVAWVDHVGPALELAFKTGNVKDQAISLATEKLRFLRPEKVLTEGALETVQETSTRIGQFVDKLNSLPGSTINSGLFGNEMVNDWAASMIQMSHQSANLHLLHANMASLKNTGHIKEFTGVIEEGFEPLTEVWRNLKYTEQGLVKFAADNGLSPEAVNRLGINSNAAKGFQAYAELGDPKVTDGLLGAIDYVTNVYKGALTIPFPAFHTRNLAGGFWQTWSTGEVGVGQLAGSFRRAANIIATQGKEGVENLDSFMRGGALKGGQLQELVGAPSVATDVIPQTFATRLRGLATTTGVKDIALQLKGIGENAYQYVEFINRFGTFDAAVRQGMAISDALALVKRTQFNYGALSGFEKAVARRVIPFYAFARNNLPFQLGKIAAAPGGRTAQTIRALTPPTTSQVDAPSYLREREVAAPLGGPPDARTFLTGSGLPVAEAFQKITLAAGKPTLRTAEKLIAQAHPLLSGLIGKVAGKQLFSGRNLKDLDSQIERATGMPIPMMRQIEQAIAVSPLSRAFSEVIKTVRPGRSIWASLLDAISGLKFSVSDTEKWRVIDLENQIRRILASDPRVKEGRFLYEKRASRERGGGEEVQEKLRLLRGLGKRREQLRAARGRS